jgi:hypothetical protein
VASTAKAPGAAGIVVMKNTRRLGEIAARRDTSKSTPASLVAVRSGSA